MTHIDRALIRALEQLGGVASEAELENLAASRGENGQYGTHGHFAKNTRALKDKGAFTTVVVGLTLWCFTDEMWQALGHSGPAPRPIQGGLF